MSVDLLAVLTGRRDHDAPRPDAGDVVTKLRCPCGTVVALLARSGGETWLWRASYRHTPRGAAEIVVDAMLEDFDALARIAEADPTRQDQALEHEVHVLGSLARATTGRMDRLGELLPPLRMPARMARVSGYAEWWRAHRAEARTAGVEPNLPAHMDAGCGRCRRVVHVGGTVAELEPAAAPPPVVVVGGEPGTKVQHIGYDGWPSQARAGRVALYQALSDVLSSD